MSCRSDEFRAYAPTGKAITWTGLNFYVIAGGCIADVWSDVDAHYALPWLMAQSSG